MTFGEVNSASPASPPPLGCVVGMSAATSVARRRVNPGRILRFDRSKPTRRFSLLTLLSQRSPFWGRTGKKSPPARPKSIQIPVPVDSEWSQYPVVLWPGSAHWSHSGQRPASLWMTRNVKKDKLFPDGF